jgi:predicted HicB family RNase H-like nuclease
MKYKGYTGTTEVDEESKVLFGRVIGLQDMITFEGRSFPELEQAFHDSVDVYLDLCADRGETPEKSFSGRFIGRVDPALRRKLSDTAEAAKLSLNSLIQAMLAEQMTGIPVGVPTIETAGKAKQKIDKSSGGASGTSQSSRYGEVLRAKDKGEGRSKSFADIDHRRPKGKEHTKKQ